MGDAILLTKGIQMGRRGHLHRRAIRCDVGGDVREGRAAAVGVSKRPDSLRLFPTLAQGILIGMIMDVTLPFLAALASKVEGGHYVLKVY